MPKRRLNANIRHMLIVAAEKLINPKETRAKLDAAYTKAEPLVRKLVEKTYPQADMAICKKYKVATKDDRIAIQLTAGGIKTFYFKPGTGPLVAKLTYQGQVYNANAPTTRVVAAWATAYDAHKEKSAALLKDYKTLILGARYVDDVTAVWPAASEHVPRAANVMVLPSAVAARIQADVAERKPKKKK